MSILNPSFEDQGALPGEAAHWTLTAVTSVQEIAGFGTSLEQAWEDFERWCEFLGDFATILNARAFFDLSANGYEAFDRGWGGGAFFWELLPAQVVPAAFGPDDVEDCESGWNNASFLWTWDSVSSVVGQFDGEPCEDFEEQWRSNESYAWSWLSVTSSPAMFDGGAQTAEDFENAWAHAATV
jgi:hypothetical protein